MKNINYKNYFKGALRYTFLKDEGVFKHNIDKDYHLFMVWEGGLESLEAIIESISRRFDILFMADVKWSNHKIAENISRFYKINDPELINSHCLNKARKGFFYCLIVEDKNPAYNYRQNISGPIRLVNTNNLAVKRELRNTIKGNFIHSSSCPEEFYEQIYLLFDRDTVSRILEDDDYRKASFEQDLIGSNGWKDFTEYFDVMNKCTNYLVQRNFEYLPNDFFENDKDVDVLCEDHEEFLLASNAKGIKEKDRTVYYITIESEDVRFDVRSVRGQYYDPAWARQMLLQKEIFNEVVFRPDDINYFFSLFYHATIQKKEIKSVYIERFKKISERMSFDFVDEEVYVSEELKAKLVSGYLKANNYKVSKPLDTTVYLNRSVLKFIEGELIDFKFSSIIDLYRKIIPSELRMLIPLPLRTLMKKFL